jgi:hypothetical protein
MSLLLSAEGQAADGVGQTAHFRDARQGARCVRGRTAIPLYFWSTQQRGLQLGNASVAPGSTGAADPFNLVGYLRSRGRRLYTGGGIEWRVDNHVLVPVFDIPVLVDLRQGEAAKLLRESRALLLRCSGQASREPTGWYYVVCDSVPDLASLHPKDRYNVKLGLRRCSVQRVTPEWLVERGYPCYAAAAERRGRQPVPAPRYRENMLATSGGPFEFWVALDAGEVVAYTECVMLGEWVEHGAVYYHPDYLRHMTTFALVRSLQEEYVLRRRLKLTNGSRTIHHDTNYNIILQRLGFRPFHCELRVAYTRMVALGVAMTYPLRGVLARFPRVPGVAAVRAVLMLEEIRRSQQKPRPESSA